MEEIQLKPTQFLKSTPVTSINLFKIFVNFIFRNLNLLPLLVVLRLFFNNILLPFIISNLFNLYFLLCYNIILSILTHRYFINACFCISKIDRSTTLLNNKKKLGIGRVRNDHPHQSAAWNESKIFSTFRFRSLVQ